MAGLQAGAAEIDDETIFGGLFDCCCPSKHQREVQATATSPPIKYERKLTEGRTVRSKDMPAEQRRQLKLVCRENARLHKRWQTPRTVLVPHRDCAAFVEERPQLRGPGALKPRVTLGDWGTACALLHFAKSKAEVCGLNFANGTNVGGGYLHGSLAQEEDLCRRMPTLYTSLQLAEQRGLYPFGPVTYQSPQDPGRFADVLFTEGLVLARESRHRDYALLAEEDQVRVSLVSAAAPNVATGEEVDEEQLRRAVVSILVAPRLAGPEVTTLVLGAWGCGAFGGDPAQISELFGRAIWTEGLGSLYDEVHFAIPKGPNADAFRKTLASFGPVEDY